MARTPTYYDILGVAPGATPEQVREAYVRLMKRHHPDKLRAADGSDAANYAPLLNRCYAVLRDPGRRASYDAELAAQVDPASSRRAFQTERIAATRSKPPQTVAWVLGAAFMGFALLIQPWTGSPIAQWLEQDGVGSSAMVTAGTIAPPPTDHEEIMRVTRRAISASPSDARMISARCFADLRTKRSRRAEDLCLAFDIAYIYWHRPSLDQSLPSYFDDSLVRIRHLNAISGGDSDPRMRLPELRDLTFRALMAQIRAEREPESKPESPPQRPGDARSSQIGTGISD